MDHALGDALMVEVHDLLAQDKILQQHRSARARLQRVLVVADRHTLVRGQLLGGRGGLLLQFATGGDQGLG